jgi:membrane protease YdiL (CAAX protease family)
VFNPNLDQLQKRKIILFYIIACLVSWPFFLLRDVFPDSAIAESLPSGVITLGYMSGPAIAALISFFVFRNRHHRTITFKGTSLTKGILFYFLPLLIFKLVTVLNDGYGDVPNDYFLIVIPTGFILILGEELGWRGYLQDVLRGMTEWKKWVFLGFLWETWHFTRGMTQGTIPGIILRKLLLYVMVIGLTFLIGKLTERTKSLFVAMTIHTWFNILFEFSSINTYITVSINLLVWVYLIYNWKGEDEQNIS